MTRDPRKPPPDVLVPTPQPVVFAAFLRRRQRFLIDVANENGAFTAHANNTGSMLGLLRPGATVALSTSDNPKRKLAHTLEMVAVPDFGGPRWVGVNTMTPNRLLRAAFERGLLPETAGYGSFRPEPPFAGGRLDALLTGPEGLLYVETKNVTMVEDGAACFPDAATERGCKHLVELTRLARQTDQGDAVRAACFFLVQRPDGACFGPADFVDPEYARLFWEALGAGVKMWPYRARVSPRGISLGERLSLAPRP